MITDLEDIDSQEMDMATALAEHEADAVAKSADSSAILMAKVVSISEEGVLVDLGEKKESLIPKDEFRHGISFAAGESIPVFVSRNGKGPARVSWKRAAEQLAWEHVQQSKLRNLAVTAVVMGETKGGLLLECEGILQAFMPASHVDVRGAKDLKSFKGQTFHAYIVEIEPRQGKLVLSRKLWLSEENQKKKTETMGKLNEGDTHSGVVTGITSFGAFVDLGGIEGLLHIGELEWARTKKVSDVLKTGQKIEVKIIKLDRENEKISLSRRELMPHPWENVESKFPIGTVVSGKVTSLTDFGAFLEIAPQVEGLLHASEITWKDASPKPKTLLKVGQTLSVKIIGLSREKEKISLSLKRTEENPWEKMKQTYPQGTILKVTVTHLVAFGAFARLPNGIEGLVHISDFSWLKRIAHPQDVLKPGEEIEVKILEVHPDKEKISLGIKQLKPNPYETYKKGSHVTGKITQVTDQGALMMIEPDLEGYIPVSEVSMEKVDSAKKVLKEGDDAEAKVTLVDVKERKIQLSIRQLDQELQRQAVKKYSAKVPRPKLGEILDS